MKPNLKKIDCSQIQEGVRFSEPVYFEDGENMFLAKGNTAKKYHVASIARWKIPYLLTAGSRLAPGAAVSEKPAAVKPAVADDDIEELEELEEV